MTSGLTVAAAGDPAPLLSLDQVSACPPGAKIPVLTDVTLKIGRGERVALVGPSGAGKTTLLRTINGQIPPAAGRVAFDGVDLGSLGVAELRRTRSHIGLVTQQHDLVDMLRVDKNVMAGALGRWSVSRALRFLIWPRQDELAQASRALADVGLADKLLRRTASLSGGERQRAAIARALVQAPTLLLADEPVASLDPETARDVLELLVKVSKTHGMALICALHQHDLADRYFERILEMRDGRIFERQADVADPVVPALHKA